MKKTAEAVSLGHPDKTADYVSSYILDCLIKQDCSVRYAVEVMIKGNTVILGGEVTGHVHLNQVAQWVKQALFEIGYTSDYANIWKDFSIQPEKLHVINLIGQQSADISQGVSQNGWGDQGVFVGYACQGEGYVSKELFLARKLNSALYEKAKQSRNLGLDIKTQITLDDNGHIETAIVAIPMLEDVDLHDFVVETLQERPKNVIINGTGRYTYHSSVADCGMTGRKLACDFYATSAPVGGGSPWTKDATKADLTLNLYARRLAVENLKDNDECFVYLSSCIGSDRLPSAEIKTIKGQQVRTASLGQIPSPDEMIQQMNLRTPIYAKLCREGITNFK